MSHADALTVVGGRYRLDERVGSGASGVVWRATDEVLGRTVAVKLLRGELSDDEEARQRLRVEARAAASLSVPGVARVYDYGTEVSTNGSTSYLVMELVDGESLRDELARNGRLDERRTMEVVAQVAGSLAAVHRLGIVHRDIKPANLLLDSEGDVRITDFGIARVGDEAPLTRTGTLVGTAQYLSPERALGRGAGAACDVYALGVIAYECVTGNRPYPSDSPVALALAHATEDFPPLPPDTSAAVASLVAAMTAKDPDDRPSADDVAVRARAAADALSTDRGPDPVATRAMTTSFDAAVPSIERLADDDDEPPPPPRASAVNWRRGARHPLSLTAATVVLVCALALLAGSRSNDAPRTVAVPQVTGVSAAKASAALEQAGLRAQVRQRNVPDTAKGRVTAQSPAAGTPVESGSTVDLTAATGLVVVRSTDYVGLSYAKAAAALEKLGLDARRGANASAPATSITTAVAPVGTVAVGRTVVVDVVAPPDSVVAGDEPVQPAGSGAKAKGKGKGKKQDGG